MSPSRTIFLIRHGEKPPESPPPHGVTLDGEQDDDHSLIARGWQRAGALAVLFAPRIGPLRRGILQPDELIAPDYGKLPKDERTHQTIEPLEKLLRLKTVRPYPVGREEKLGELLSTKPGGVTLVCWEHKHIPDIVRAIEPSTGSLPKAWPDDRFDLIWSMRRDESAVFRFEQIAQLLLAGDQPVDM